MIQAIWILFFIFETCYGDGNSSTMDTRRIVDGIEPNLPKPYMVYLVQADEKKDKIKYDSWICGGAIVSSEFILTSAACVEDVVYMYAIAGTKEYDKDILTKRENACSVKKVTYICVPKQYEFSYDKVAAWTSIDIALVKVEDEYNFDMENDPNCAWAPKKIDINYDPKYQSPETDAMVLGWGHTEKWRQPKDPVNYNSDKLLYTPVLIMDKTECLNQYANFNGMHENIKKYMICTERIGFIDEYGNITKKFIKLTDGCAPGAVRVGNTCQFPNEPELDPQKNSWIYENLQGSSRISGQVQNPELRTLGTAVEPELKTETEQNKQSQKPEPSYDDITFDDIVGFRRENSNDSKYIEWTRKNGICQNDHGGPLVSWAGAHEVVIGVASAFRLDKDWKCIGPYLYTSTQCNGAFLDCVLNNGTTNFRIPGHLEVTLEQA